MGRTTEARSTHQVAIKTYQYLCLTTKIASCQAKPTVKNYCAIIFANTTTQQVSATTKDIASHS